MPDFGLGLVRKLNVHVRVVKVEPSVVGVSPRLSFSGGCILHHSQSDAVLIHLLLRVVEPLPIGLSLAISDEGDLARPLLRPDRPGQQVDSEDEGGVYCESRSDPCDMRLAGHVPSPLSTAVFLLKKLGMASILMRVDGLGACGPRYSQM